MSTGENRNKQKNEKHSRLWKLIYENQPDESGFAGSYFAEHRKEMDIIMATALAVYFLVILIPIGLECFSENELLIRRDPFSTLALPALNLILLVTTVIGWRGRGTERHWYKYLVVIVEFFVNLAFNIYKQGGELVMMIVPVFLAIFYYDSRFLIETSILTVLSKIIGTSIYYRAYLIADYPLAATIPLTKGTILFNDLIDLVMLVILAMLSLFMMLRLRKTLGEKLQKEAEKAIIDEDMLTANHIQTGMLTRSFPDRKEFLVSARMTPARQVGGDFYDFIELDHDRVAIIVADVSGKGLQAAMFMSQTMALFRVYALAGNSPDKIAEKTNAYMTRSNRLTRLFVTAWIGILDLRTGMLSFTNAGHNPPCLAKNGNNYELLKSRINFVVGGKSLIRYSENQLILKPGDRLFLYTDGVTEAKDPEGGFFGENAMLECLNETPDAEPDRMVEIMDRALERHKQGTEAYDDTTMLAFSFREYAVKREVTSQSFPADREHFEMAIKYVLDECRRLGCGKTNILKDIEVACSEVVANICSYAYEGKEGDFSINVEMNENAVRITFVDSGTPFNPLLKDTPDTTLTMKQRKVGGFGIFMVRKLMSDVAYRYENNRNHLTLTKSFR